jgi:dTDP-4-amino-4,6-dideoxygalactose transaminase
VGAAGYGGAVQRILLSPPDVGEPERQAVLRAFDGGWIAPVGPEVDAFERELAGYVGAESCAALASGTAALHLALLVSGVGPGDEVVVQSATFAASAFAVRHCGATPVFCDSERRTWNLDPGLLADHLEDRAAVGCLPAAVVAVDLYGLCADYASLRPLCRSYGVPLIEDAAEALGSICQGMKAASLGDLGVLSFNGNKLITTSGGGALVGPTDVVDRARHLASQARQPVLHYEHHEVGFNYRLSNLLAALGRAQLARVEERVAHRREVFDRYRRALPALDWLDDGVTERSNRWLSVALLPPGVDPHAICTELDRVGIEARPAWKPMHLQPVFGDCEHLGGAVSEELFHRGLCLPSGSSLTEGQQSTVVAEVSRLLG